VSGRGDMITPRTTTQPQVDLCNQAFRALGELPIVLPFDGTIPRCWLVSQFYDQVQDALMAEHFWAFATVRTTLTADLGPVWGWPHSFALPPGYVALQRTEDSSIVQREGALLLSHEAPLTLTYTAQPADPTLWPPYFTTAFVAALTATFAEQITGQLDKHKVWLELAKIRLKRAIELDNLEDSPSTAQSSWATGPARDLVNQALRALGDLPRPSRFLLSPGFFETVRDRVLAAHFWNFATVRAVLTASGTPPAWGSGNVFPLPDDYLAMQRVETGVRYH